MIDLSDLGLAPVTSAATQAAAPVVSNPREGLVPGSVKARLLYSVFARQKVVCCDSPPGAGKTTLIVSLLDELARRSDFTMVVATPTKRGAHDLSARLVKEVGTRSDSPAVVLGIKGLTAADRPEGVRGTPPESGKVITIRTIKSCAMGPPECDLMVFDEAYQATYADVMAAADSADQVVMVGDPGQIGPVVTQNTSAWDDMASAPHKRAPEVFSLRDDAITLQLDATYRVGQQTVDAIAPLYGFPFVSKRPDRHLVRPDGTALPEIASTRIAPADSVSDLSMLKTIANLATSMVGSTVHATDDNGDPVTTEVTARDVAIVVSRSVMASNLQAILRSTGHEGVTVGTADKLQGGEWHAVVAVDPLVGETAVGPHQVNQGRLCVMASRHKTHLTWVHDGSAVERLTAASDDHPEAKVGLAVRRHLTAPSTVLDT